MKSIKFVIFVLLMISIISSCHQTAPTEVGNSSPKIPINFFPPDDTTGINIELTFQWQAEDPNENDILTFSFYLEAGNPNPNILFTNLSTDSVVMTDLKYDTTYYWKIVAKDQQGDSTSSPVWSFKTRHEFNSPPNIPQNPEPTNGATSIPINSVLLKWQGGDPDYYSIVNYDVLLGESPNSLNVVSENQPDTTHATTLLRYSNKYYWKIIAQDDYQNTTEGPVWSFETLLPETIFRASFDTDDLNESPSSLKWTVWGSSADIFVTDELTWNNQGKSVCFTDSSIEGSSYLAASVTPKNVGMLQFHFLMTSNEDYFGVRMYSEVADSNHLGPQISLREGKLQYYDNSNEWQAVNSVETNTWYFLQVVFDCDQQFFNLFLDDVLVAEKITWTGTVVPNLDLFYFLTFQNRKCEKAYIDDVKFLADP